MCLALSVANIDGSSHHLYIFFIDSDWNHFSCNVHKYQIKTAKYSCHVHKNIVLVLFGVELYSILASKTNKSIANQSRRPIRPKS